MGLNPEPHSIEEAGLLRALRKKKASEFARDAAIVYSNLGNQEAAIESLREYMSHMFPENKLQQESKETQMLAAMERFKGKTAAVRIGKHGNIVMGMNDAKPS